MKKIIFWSLLSVILQIGGLFVLNNYIFTTSTEFSAEVIEVSQPTSNVSEIKIDSKCDNYRLSDSGKYISFESNNDLHITDVKTGEDLKYEVDSNTEILNYSWVYRNDVLQLAEKVKTNTGAEVQLSTYNIKTKEKKFVKTLCNYQDGLTVGNISSSIFTGVYYVNVVQNEYVSKIYRIDRNNDLTTIDTDVVVVDNIRVVPNHDRLVFSDKSTGQISLTSPNAKLNFNSSSKYDVLNVTENNNIYIGELKDDNIISIHYGNVSDDISTWKNIKLDTPVHKKDLFFSSTDKIYLNDNLAGSVKNLLTGEELQYEGKFLQIRDTFIASINNNGILVLQKISTK